MRARPWLAVPVVVLVAFVGACTGEPPPPVRSSPVAETRTPAQDGEQSRVVVGVERIAGGYNPHLRADSSTITSALAKLLLPSVFRPADASNDTGQGDDTGQGGAARTGLVLDQRVMESARVSSTDPFTVSYVVRDDASWSDGAPVAAEDFTYLADAMRNRPGVVNPAGYRLIEDIRSRDGGKRVEVVFAERYPAWRTLFDNLLPAHLLKDAPGGWSEALSSGFPAYGGPFAIESIDMTRGEVVLRRNERYWADPAKPERVVLRRTDEQGMAAALRSGAIQLALTDTDATGLKLLDQLGDQVRQHTITRDRLVSVLLRPRGTPLSDERVREAIAALIDRDALIEVGVAGGSAADLRADAQVRAPSDAAYEPTLPSDSPLAGHAPERAGELLRQAGYTRADDTWRKNGAALSLVVATPGTRQPYARVGEALASQLAAAGIEVRTVAPKPRELFHDRLAGGQNNGDNAESQESADAAEVDIAVVPQEVGGDPASQLASRFGCPAQREGESARRVRAGAVPFCTEQVRSLIRSALTGATPVADALAELEPKLWQAHVTMPLFQRADTLAIGGGIAGIEPGQPDVGPFASATEWERVPE